MYEGWRFSESQSIYQVQIRAWRSRQDEAIIFIAFLIFYFCTAVPLTHNNEHILLAWSLLHGHAWIDGDVWEQVIVRGHRFILHPPLAAIVCMPFVAIGITNQVWISVLIGAVGVALAYRLTQSYWLTIFFGVGTIYWYETTLGAAWGFCLILSCIPTLMALCSIREGARGVVVGIWGGVAALARIDLWLVVPIYAFWKRDWRVLLGALPALLLYIGFNYWRFGNLTDPSIWLWYQADTFRKSVGDHGPFSLYYFPYNLYTLLFMAPVYIGRSPWAIPMVTGQALVLTSPAFLTTLSSRAHEKLWLWLCVALAMIPSMTVWSNGVEQFGFRYAIQVYPFLLALMPVDRMAKILIVASIILVAWGVIDIRIYRMFAH